MDDDTARDVHGDYMARFNAGKGPAEIMRELREAWAGTIDDEDEGPVFWVAVAKAQWDCGHLGEDVLVRVRGMVERGEGLARWEEEGPKALAKRKAELARFAELIAEPCPRPRKPKKATKRKPVFRAGDCVAVRLSDGDWGAVVVLAEETPNTDPAVETFGQNVVGVLRYKGKEKPGPEVFEGRDWLWLTHHNWMEWSGGDPRGVLQVTAVARSGFRAVKDRFEVVGRTEIRDTDPREARALSSWEFVEQVVLQERWDRGERS